MYETLVLSSGGIRGLAILGALQELNNNRLLDNINHFIGCSTGSIISLLINIGYTIDNIIQFYLNINFWDKININLDSIFNLTTLMGLSDSSGNLKNILDILLINSKVIKVNKLNLKELTFLKLYEITNVKLTFCVSNLNTCTPNYLNYENNPDMLVEKGLRMSCTIPFIFQPINNCIDGAICNSYPIDQTNNIIKTIGIMLQDNKETDIDDPIRSNIFIQFINNIVRSIENKVLLDNDVEKHTIIVKCSRSTIDKQKILNSGIFYGKKFIKNRSKSKVIFHLFTIKFIKELNHILLSTKIKMSSVKYAISQANKIAKLAALDAVRSLKKIEWLLNIKKLEHIVNKFKNNPLQKLDTVINFENMKR